MWNFFIFVLLAVFITGCSKEKIIVSLSDDGKKVHSSFNQDVIVTLPEMSTAGYQWLPCESQKLEVIEAPAETSNKPVKTLGAPIIKFFAIKPKVGTYGVCFQHKRSWEKEFQSEFNFTLIIE